MRDLVFPYKRRMPVARNPGRPFFILDAENVSLAFRWSRPASPANRSTSAAGTARDGFASVSNFHGRGPACASIDTHCCPGKWCRVDAKNRWCDRINGPLPLADSRWCFGGFSAIAENEEIADAVEEFLTGSRAQVAIDRVLATVLLFAYRHRRFD
jgi:hypothetical protein